MSSLTLHEIITQNASLIRLIEASNGELTPEIEEALTINETNMAVKVDSYAAFLDKLELENKYYAEIAAGFAARARQYKELQEYIKGNLKKAMKAMDAKQIQGNYYKFTLSFANPSLVITDESKIPSEYKYTEILTHVEKDKLKEALKNHKVEGANLVETYALRKSVSKNIL